MIGTAGTRDYGKWHGPAGSPSYKRAFTLSSIAVSSGNTPVFSFEYSSAPFALSSKHPPPAGTSVNDLIFCLYAVRSFAAKLTAFGS